MRSARARGLVRYRLWQREDEEKDERGDSWERDGGDKVVVPRQRDGRGRWEHELELRGNVSAADSGVSRNTRRRLDRREKRLKASLWELLDRLHCCRLHSWLDRRRLHSRLDRRRLERWLGRS